MTHSNKLAQVTGEALYYDIDTAPGQSGSAVYIKKGNANHVIGIHKAFEPRLNLNCAAKITTEMIAVL